MISPRVIVCAVLVFTTVVVESRSTNFLENPLVGKTDYYALFWQIIFPGTKWCGDGDIAENDDDLGFFKETDMCCRDHDKCDDVIHAGETKYGLTNDGKYTRLHCKCDSAFFECLKDVSKPISATIGTVYFNTLGGQCYEENYPIVKCLVYESIVGLRKRCLQYELDETQPKEWQWFDVPRFISMCHKE